jgi:type IV pilus assembly protein PilQ
LQLEVVQDSPAGGTSGTINTNSLKTQVLVADGETIVLGGVYRFEDVEEISKVPVLGDLPVLGGLFRQSRQATLKNELLIFLTPTILPY